MNIIAEDDLACTDEIKVYEDEGEEDEQVKSSENLTEDKVGLVIESEEQVPRLFNLFGRNGSSILKMPWPTDPRFTSYFLPGYPAALAAVMAAMRSSASPVCGFSTPCGPAAASSSRSDYSSGPIDGGFLSGLASSSTSPTAPAPLHLNSSFYTPSWEPQGLLATNSSVFGSPTATGVSGDGCMDGSKERVTDDQCDSAIDDCSHTPLPRSRMPHILSNPFVSFHKHPLHGLSATTNVSGAHEPIVRSPMERLFGDLDSTQNSSGLKSGLGIHPSTEPETSHPMGEFWRRGQSASLKPDITATSASTPYSSSSSSSSLYAAVMAAAVASWSDQSASTASSITSTFATGIPSFRRDPLGNNSADSCFEDVDIKRTKSFDVSKTSYSSSMFAAAAAAHMRFLSAAAAAASITSILPSVQASTVNPVHSSTKSKRSTEDVLTSALTSANRTVPSDACLGSPAVTASKSFVPGRHHSCKPNCDFDAAPSSPPDEALSEPESNLLISRLKKTHIKKPLNAFMLFMKEMRPRVQEECTLKESAAINQILGKKWHELSRAEQTKYYEMARQAKELHQRLYPGWSARDNYAYHARRRHRRIRRPFPHPRSFIYKPIDRSSAINSISKAFSTSRLRSSSLNEDRKILESSHKIIDRPHSTNDVYSPSLERRVTSSSLLSPPPPPLSSVITNVVPERQHQHTSLPSQPSLPPPPPLQTPLPSQVATFVSSPQLPRVLVSPSRPISTLANSALTVSACSAFAQHYNQNVHPQPHYQHQQQHPTMHHQQSNHQQFLHMPPSRTFSCSASSASAAIAASMHASAQNQERAGAMVRSSTGYWGYRGLQIASHQSAVKENPYFSVEAGINSDSVAAVAAVAAMAVGELSGGSMKKCRARFGLEHQNLWCKPCRRKKKCIRFISESDADDYMPYYHPYHTHSAAAVAFNHNPPHQQSQLPQAPHQSYGLFTATHRHANFSAGPCSGLEETSGSHLRKQPFMQAWVPPMGNGIGVRESTPRCNSATSVAAATNSNYVHPSINSSYKRQFPMLPISRQQLLTSEEYARVSNTLYAGGGNHASHWGHSSRSSTTTTTAACFPYDVMMSQGDPKRVLPLLRQTQGSNSFPSTYLPPKMNRCPHTQQGTTLATNASAVNSITSTPTLSIPPAATNGSSGGDQPFKRGAAPLSFGVADVMGFRLSKESSASHKATATTSMPIFTPSTNAALYRGNVSPSTSSCPLRSSPELE